MEQFFARNANNEIDEVFHVSRSTPKGDYHVHYDFYILARSVDNAVRVSGNLKFCSFDKGSKIMDKGEEQFPAIVFEDEEVAYIRFILEAHDKSENIFSIDCDLDEEGKFIEHNKTAAQ